MKIDRDTRRVIYASGGRPVTFTYSGPVVPRVDQVYALETESRGPAYDKVRVVSRQQIDEDRWRVAVRLEGDPVRLLPRAAGDYTDRYEYALRDGIEPEPEAVNEDAQRRITGQARMGDAERAFELADEIAALLSAIVAIRDRRDAKAVRKELWQAHGRLEAARKKLQQVVRVAENPDDAGS